MADNLRSRHRRIKLHGALVGFPSFLSAPSSPHACLPIQSTHLSDGSDKLGEHTQRHYGS